MKAVLFLLFVSFSAVLYAELPEWMKHQSIVDNFVWNSTKPFKGNNLEKIRSYSKVLHEEQSIYTDPYHGPEVGAKRRIFQFSGVKVRGFFIPGKRFFLEYVEVTSPAFTFVGGIKVGSSEKELIKHFKHLGRKKENTITYSGETENVIFTIKNGYVTKVQLYGYTG